jgi:hypothetical protein
MFSLGMLCALRGAVRLCLTCPRLGGRSSLLFPVARAAFDGRQSSVRPPSAYPVSAFWPIPHGGPLRAADLRGSAHGKTIWLIFFLPGPRRPLAA